MVGEGCGDDLVGQHAIFLDDLADIDVLNWMVVVAELELAANRVKIRLFKRGAERVLGVAESNNRRDGSFDLLTPQALPAAKKAPEKAAPKPPQAPGAVRLEEIEPLYRPWVQGYFRQLRE